MDENPYKSPETVDKPPRDKPSVLYIYGALAAIVWAIVIGGWLIATAIVTHLTDSRS